MKYQKIINLIDVTSDNVPRFITENGLKFMISLLVQKIDTNQVNKKDLKHQCYNQIYVITVMHILLLKDILVLQRL